MASQIANTMSAEDKDAIENMDMEKMISHVTKNVFKMMNTGEENGENPLEGGEQGFATLMSSMTSVLGNFKEMPGTMESPLVKEKSVTFAPKTRDICFDLNVDLVDFYTGKKKKLHIKRKRVVELDGKQKIVEEKKKIVIPIEKGMKDEQQIRFEGEADQIPGYIPGDIIITLIENEHPEFQRENDNLIIIKNINLYQAYDYSFDITHLDSRILRITKNNTDSLHLNDSLRKITGQGMPIYKKDNTFGDLFIRFNLIIPKSLEPSKLAILKLFDDSTPEPLAEDYSKQFILENVTETDLEDLDDYTDSETESDTDSEDISVSSVSVSDINSDSDSERIPLKRRPMKR